MSHFYGLMDGTGRTTSKRTGTKQTGLSAQVASMKGSIKVDLMHNEETGEDWATVSLEPWNYKKGNGSGIRRQLWRGLVSGADATVYRIRGRRWFRKSAGNTYSSVEVYADDELLERSDPEGGYGDYYLQMAWEILAKSGRWDDRTRESSGCCKGETEFRQAMREQRDRFDISVEDVKRERDLMNW